MIRVLRGRQTLTTSSAARLLSTAGHMPRQARSLPLTSLWNVSVQLCATLAHPPCARQTMEKRSVKEETKFLETLWQCDPRWSETTRPYSAKDVVSLRGCASAPDPARDRDPWP